MGKLAPIIEFVACLGGGWDGGSCVNGELWKWRDRVGGSSEGSEWELVGAIGFVDALKRSCEWILLLTYHPWYNRCWGVLIAMAWDGWFDGCGIVNGGWWCRIGVLVGVRVDMGGGGRVWRMLIGTLFWR
ncbi:hypothetical protein Tco_0825186 [Tanacetum coccineum]